MILAFSPFGCRSYLRSVRGSAWLIFKWPPWSQSEQPFDPSPGTAQKPNSLRDTMVQEPWGAKQKLIPIYNLSMKPVVSSAGADKLQVMRVPLSLRQLDMLAG